MTPGKVSIIRAKTSTVNFSLTLINEKAKKGIRGQ